VPTGFAAYRRCSPIAVIAIWCAIWLLVLQAFLAGVATARAGAMLASGSIDSAAICHTLAGDDRSGGEPADGAAPDAIKAWHLCCAGCTVSAHAAPSAPDVATVEPLHVTLLPAPAGFAVVLPRGAIRAGPSQAPPTLA
jgi:hypothetical protein